jgi:hypothetical protein
LESVDDGVAVVAAVAGQPASLPAIRLPSVLYAQFRTVDVVEVGI